jgi:hypothetical protein
MVVPQRQLRLDQPRGVRYQARRNPEEGVAGGCTAGFSVTIFRRCLPHTRLAEGWARRLVSYRRQGFQRLFALVHRGSLKIRTQVQTVFRSIRRRYFARDFTRDWLRQNAFWSIHDNEMRVRAKNAKTGVTPTLPTQTSQWPPRLPSIERATVPAPASVRHASLAAALPNLPIGRAGLSRHDYPSDRRGGWSAPLDHYSSAAPRHWGWPYCRAPT